MYFIVYKKDDKFERTTLPSSTPWEQVVASLEGTLVELFENDILEVRSFDEYFFSNYRNERKAKKQHESKVRRQR